MVMVVEGRGVIINRIHKLKNKFNKFCLPHFKEEEDGAVAVHGEEDGAEDLEVIYCFLIPF